MIIEVDAFKKLIPDYNPEKSEDFHTQSARLADKAFEVALKSRKFTKVVFLAGGAASGKTEFASLYLQD
jgi:chloramphenicol 3-O-phosphotransferase